MKNLTRILSLTLLSLMLSGCISGPAGPLDPIIQSQAPQMVIATRPVGKGYYAVIEKSSGRWQVAHLQKEPISSRDNDNQEILFVNRSLRSIAPSFGPRMNPSDHSECTPLAHNQDFYGLCTSYFSSTQIAHSIGKNIVSCGLTFCLAAGTWEELDRDKIQQVVIESELLSLVKKRITEDNRKDYLTVFNDAVRSRDSSQLEDFIDRYRNNDPDKLVPEAMARIQSMKDTQDQITQLIEVMDKMSGKLKRE
ncbi:MAG: hypothetical protein ACXWTY_09600 [Methylobacter sp.]